MEALPHDPRLTEARNPRTVDIHRGDAREVVRRIQAEDRAVPLAVQAQAEAIATVVEEVAGRLRRGGRLFYVGAGTSGRLGVLDAAECPPTFGTDPELVQGVIAGGPEALLRSREGVEDDREAGRAAIADADVAARDFVLGIAASGTTPFVTAALHEAAGRGAGVGFLSCSEPPAEVRELTDTLITVLVGPEVITGSTRMKAGTATKLVLNTLTTGVMIRLGKVYRNLMVDLRAVSLKLVDRSLRIVQEAGEVDRARARRLLVAAGGSAKTAIAMARLEAERFVAERLLDACDGFLGAVLDRWSPGDRFPEYAGYSSEPDRAAVEWLRERLSGASRRLRGAAERAAGEARRDPVEGVPPGRGWSAAEHLAHLLQFETEAIRPRVERLREAPTDAPDDAPVRFPDWQPTTPPPLSSLPVAELAGRLEEARQRTVAALPPPGPAWARRLRIGEEEVNLYQFLRGVAHHDEAHRTRMVERVHPALLEPERGEGAPG